MEFSDTQLAGRRGAFLALVVAEFVSITGSEISALAVPWFVLVTTGSPVRTGLALAAEFVGMLAFGVPAGEMVARLGARRTMLLADAVRGCLIAAIPILHTANALSFPALLSILLAVGAVFPAHSSAAQLVLATVVGQDHIRLTRGNGFIGSFGGGSMIGGLLSAKVVRRFGIGRVAVGAYAVEAAAMWVLATSPPAGGVIAAVAVDGLCMGIFMPALFAEMTVRTPAALR